MPQQPLPVPGSPELSELPVSGAAKAIYSLLYEHREAAEPLSMQEIRDLLGGGEIEQFDRRRRELNRYFDFEKTRVGRRTAYRLVGRKPISIDAAAGISERDRAAVLRLGRCAMCGRTPLDDGVRLQVDHKIPAAWGGTNDPENLQPLCEECNRGKRDFFATYAVYTEQIRAAMLFDHVHVRIGELLKAFDGEWVSTDLISLVASATAHQEDYQKRLRELRVLGWKIDVERRSQGNRSVAYYKVVEWQPWPDVPPRIVIRYLESQRRRAREQRPPPSPPGIESND